MKTTRSKVIKTLREFLLYGAIASAFMSATRANAAEFESTMLRTIASVESDSGKYTDHQLIDKGLNKGTKAYGRYGLMPITIVEVGRKTPSILKAYPRFADLKIEEVPAFMKTHPELEERIAKSHLHRLVKIFGDRPEVIGYAWLAGIGGAQKALLMHRDLMGHWHVKKIMVALSHFGGWKTPLERALDLDSILKMQPQPSILVAQ